MYHMKLSWCYLIINHFVELVENNYIFQSNKQLAGSNYSMKCNIDIPSIFIIESAESQVFFMNNFYDEIREFVQQCEDFLHHDKAKFCRYFPTIDVITSGDMVTKVNCILTVYFVRYPTLFFTHPGNKIYS